MKVSDLPILEAMACGRAVACSNTSSMPEVADGAGLLFDPHQTGEITRALKDILLDSELRGRLERLGLQRAAGFTWKKSARATLDVYKEVVHEVTGKTSGAVRRQTSPRHRECPKAMRTFFVFAALSLAAAVTTAAQAAAPVANQPTLTGFPFTDEDLNYSINWPTGNSLGEAHLHAKHAGANWNFSMTLDAGVPGFTVKDSYHSDIAARFLLHLFRPRFGSWRPHCQ